MCSINEAKFNNGVQYTVNIPPMTYIQTIHIHTKSAKIKSKKAKKTERRWEY